MNSELWTLIQLHSAPPPSPAPSISIVPGICDLFALDDNTCTFVYNHLFFKIWDTIFPPDTILTKRSVPFEY